MRTTRQALKFIQLLRRECGRSSVFLGVRKLTAGLIITLGCVFVCLGDPPEHGPSASASASPNEAPAAHPAPVWRFDGEDYYLVDRDVRPGERSLAFLKDGDSPDRCNRRLWLRKVAGRDLRAYELAYTKQWDQTQRDVTYRSSTRLVHSGWVQKGPLLYWRQMHWEVRGGAIVCSEFELLSRPPTPDLKAMTQLVTRQQPSWREQVTSMMKQASTLLQV